MESLELETCENKEVFQETDNHICENVLIAKFPHLKRCTTENTHNPEHFVSFVELAPTFTAAPPDPLYVLEGNNITLVWQYNLDGSFDDVVLQFINSFTTLTIVDKHDINRDAAVPESVYLGRIRENINATRAEITIFTLQRSESAEYEIELININRKRASNRVTVQVQCK